MNPAHRCGSVLFLCLAIVVALAMIAFAFLRVASLHAEGGASETRMLLAREAARMGLAHATEQIIRDFSASGSFSRMDDSSHAAFVSNDRQYESDYATDRVVPPQLVNVDDVPAENNLLQSFSPLYNDWNSLANQQHIFDGRGRFHEPGFQNRAVAGVDLARTEPMAPVRFGSPWPAASPLPDRSDGIFYDVHLRRITGDPRAARDAARYRLRYSVGVVDLDGTLLVNGDQAVPYRDLTAAGPLDVDSSPAHALTAAERVLRWKNALPQVVYAGSTFGNMQYGWGAGVAGGERVAHVFMGRGTTANFDRDPARAYAPVSFPYMYRNATVGNFMDASPIGPAPDFYAGSVTGGAAIPSGEKLVHALTGAQFSFTNFDEAVQGTGWDGDGGHPGVLGRFTPFGRGLAKTGAAGRWSGNVDTPWCVNVMTAPASVIYGMVAGYMPPGAIAVYYHQKPPTGLPAIPNGDWTGASYSAALLGTRDLFAKEFSPAFGPGFGDYVTPYRASPAVSVDYHRPEPRTFDQRYPGAIAANGDDGAGWVHDDLGFYLRAVKRTTVSTGADDGRVDATGRPEVVRLERRYKERLILPNPGQPRTESYWWRHSERLLGSTAVKTGGPPPSTLPAPPEPPSWSNAVAYRSGSLVRVVGIAPAPTRYYRATADIPVPVAPLPAAPVPPEWVETTLTAELPDWDEAQVGAHPDSIWEAVGNALASAVAVARGQYMQYPSLTMKPAKYFNGTQWNPAWGPRVAGIKDLDALFVRALGSDFTRPNDPTPVAGWQASGWSPDDTRVIPLVPSWNLAGLRTAVATVQVANSTGPRLPGIVGSAAASPLGVDLGLPQAPLGTYTFPIAARNHPGEPRYDSSKPTVSADDRTAIAELIINDFRLSLFGASPEYGNDFRALDLNGDGKAHCSGFRSSGGGPLGQYTANLDAGGTARVPVDTYFATTGCFFIGKSRFWRVMVRGELWDNVLRTAVDCAQLDAVLCVDPADEAKEWTASGPGVAPDPAKGQYGTHVIYQRWFYNTYRGLMPRRQ